MNNAAKQEKINDTLAKSILLAMYDGCNYVTAEIRAYKRLFKRHPKSAVHCMGSRHYDHTPLDVFVDGLNFSG